MDRTIAAVIDTLNRGKSLYDIMVPAGKIRQMLKIYGK